MMGKVFITGANGFIGSHVTELFCEKGVLTGCLVRKGSDLSNLHGLPVKLEYGDITDMETLGDLLKGYGSVIHIAAYARDLGDYRTFYNTNVEGTLNVLRACVGNGIKNVILTSSVSVYGEENCTHKKDENSPFNSHYKYFLDRIFPSKMNYYRDTKALAKKRAVEYAAQNGLNLTILEPVWVFGEREFNTGFYDYIKTAKSGIPFLPGSKSNKFHVVYVKDLARAYYMAYVNKFNGINAFIIGNEEAGKMDGIYSLFCEKAGVVKPHNLPKFTFYPIGFVMELLYTIFNIKSAPLLTRGRINMFYDSIEYSTDKARELLGFTNRFTLEEGMERAVKWYKDRNLI
jgi:nucleoside-diphosphate-sugar epimerase